MIFQCLYRWRTVESYPRCHGRGGGFGVEGRYRPRTLGGLDGPR